MSDDVIHIVLTCDDKYAQHAAVTIVSVVKNTKRKVHFHVFDCGILPENLERLKRLDVGANVLEVVQVQKIDVFENYEYPRCYSPAIMYRLAIPKILPHLDKALYLDSDVIAVRDVGLIWDIDLGDKLLAGGDQTPFFPFKWVEMFRIRFGIPMDTPYINSGALMNLRKMRIFEFSKKCIEILKNEPWLPGDMEVVNKVLSNNHQLLLWDVRYHFMEPLLIPRRFYSMQPVLIHFTGSKPWRFREVFLKYLPGKAWDMERKYYEYLNFTPWCKQRNAYCHFGSFLLAVLNWLARRSLLDDACWVKFKLKSFWRS